MTVGLARKLSRTKPHREALLKNLVTQLLQHGTITSTHEKCKEASRLAERVITWAKKVHENSESPLAAQIQSKLFLSGDNSKLMKRLLNEIAPQYMGRDGGYTRVLHLEPRLGDRAKQSILELVNTPVLDANGNIQRGNMKLWIAVRYILRDEERGAGYKTVTLQNLNKMLLGKSKEQLSSEILTIKKLFKKNDKLAWDTVAEEKKVAQLMEQINSVGATRSNSKKKPGYSLAEDIAREPAHIAG